MSKKLAIAMFGQKRLSREGGVEIVVKELCTRMAQNGCEVTCYNRAGHHVSGAEYDDAGKTEYEGIRQKSVPTIERRGLAAVSSSAFAALYSAFGKYDVVHIHAEGPAFFAWLPKMFGKRVVVTVHGIDFLENYSELKIEIAELDVLIEDLSAYMRSTGKKYADHAATLRSWSARKKKQQKPGTGIPDYTYNEEESL